MTNVFLTKVWGVAFDSVPILGFSTEGARLNFLRASKPGDWVYVVGTKTDNTPEQLKGKVLARVQLGRDLYNATSVMEACGYQPHPNEFDKRGSYRWPFALPVIRFETIDGDQVLTEVVGEFNDGTHFAAYALNVETYIGQGARDALLELATTQREVPRVPMLDEARAHQDHQAFKARVKGQSGPGPTSGTTLHQRIDIGGYTYLFQFFHGQSATNRYKIGYAVDAQKRLATLNNGLFSSVTGWHLKLVFDEPFAHAAYAYNMEQHMLLRFADAKLENEIEVVVLSERLEFEKAIFSACKKALFLKPPKDAAPFEEQAADLDASVDYRDAERMAQDPSTAS